MCVQVTGLIAFGHGEQECRIWERVASASWVGVGFKLMCLPDRCELLQAQDHVWLSFVSQVPNTELEVS